MKSRWVVVGVTLLASVLLAWMTQSGDEPVEDALAPTLPTVTATSPVTSLQAPTRAPVISASPKTLGSSASSRLPLAKQRQSHSAKLAEQRNALYALVNQGGRLDGPTIDRLFAVIRSSRDVQSLTLAIWGLSKVSDAHRAAVIGELAELLASHAEWEVRLEALKSLAQLRGPVAERAARGALASDTTAEVRGVAATLLANLFPETAAIVESLRLAAQRDRVPEVRARVILALAVSQSEQTTQALRLVARNAPTAGGRAMARHKLEERYLMRLASGSGPQAVAARKRLASMLAASPGEMVKEKELNKIVSKDVIGRRR